MDVSLLKMKFTKHCNETPKTYKEHARSDNNTQSCNETLKTRKEYAKTCKEHVKNTHDNILSAL